MLNNTLIFIAIIFAIELILIVRRSLLHFIDKNDLQLLFKKRVIGEKPTAPYTDIFNKYCENEHPKDVFPYFKDKEILLIGGDLRDKYKKLVRSASKVTNLDLVTKRNIFHLIYDSNNTKKTVKMDGSDLRAFPDNSFDGVASSHLIEHLANPINGVLEWVRVTKVGGIIHIALPNKPYTFDRNRPITSLEHIKKDLEQGIKQDDKTHLKEFADLWDESMDYCFTRKQFNNNIRKFPQIFLHHHVFDEASFFKFISMFGVFRTIDFYVKEDTIYWSGELIKKPATVL